MENDIRRREKKEINDTIFDGHKASFDIKFERRQRFDFKTSERHKWSVIRDSYPILLRRKITI